MKLSELKEKCAKICDEQAKAFSKALQLTLNTEKATQLDGMKLGAFDCAAAIRAIELPDKYEHTFSHYEALTDAIKEQTEKTRKLKASFMEAQPDATVTQVAPADVWIDVGKEASWTVRRNEENDEYEKCWEVLKPNGEWESCIGIDAADARDCIKKGWEKEQLEKVKLLPPSGYAAAIAAQPVPVPEEPTVPGWALKSQIDISNGLRKLTEEQQRTFKDFTDHMQNVVIPDLLAKRGRQTVAAESVNAAPLTAPVPDDVAKDAKRLDWMEKNLIRDASMRFEDGTFKAVNAWAIASASTDLREAIDAAIAASQQKGK